MKLGGGCFERVIYYRLLTGFDMWVDRVKGSGPGRECWALVFFGLGRYLGCCGFGCIKDLGVVLF